MKATKLVMITALVSFALMSFASAEPGMSKNVISLKAALQSPQLVQAIYSQVNPADIFNYERAGNYTVHVVLKKSVYLISGSFNEWNLFFRDVDGLSILPKPVKKQASLNDEDPLRVGTNPFGTAKTRINPYSEKDPFGEKGKKPIPSKKVIKVLLDKR